MTIQLSRITYGTTAEGPGLRTAVWFQGCSIRCKGCINPQLFSKSGGTAVDPSTVVEGALEQGCEGITLVGGEPFDQATGAAELAELARAVGLGVLTFTGFTYEDLLARGDAERRLISATDLLIDGQFMSDSGDSLRALVGSTNQRFIHLTERYAEFDAAAHPNRIDVRIAANGSIEVAGFLDSKQLGDLMDLSETRRVPKRK